MTQNIWAKIGYDNIFHVVFFFQFFVWDEYYGNDITDIDKILYTTNTSNDVD